MKICLFKNEDSIPRVGIFEKKNIVDVQQVIDVMTDLGISDKLQINGMPDLIFNFSLVKEIVKKAKEIFNDKFISLFADSSAVLLAPVSSENKILCLGKNYRAHAEEIGDQIPKEPILFGKFASCVIGPGEKVIYPDFATRVDPEVELAIIIGKKGRNIPIAMADEYIFGYTIANDFTERNMEFEDMKLGNPWFRSKNFDTFMPIGPYIVTKEEIVSPQNLEISLSVNGEVRQKGNTKDMIFDVYQLVSYISKYLTLSFGDIISTGTVPGIKPIKRGDKVIAKIDGIGEIINEIK